MGGGIFETAAAAHEPLQFNMMQDDKICPECSDDDCLR